MVHGRSRIKLYNAISGNVIKDVVNENTFQSSIIAEGLRELGYAKASPYCTADTSNPPFVEILGGLLLFKERITGSPQFLPLGNEMTGNAAYGITNSGSLSEMGSFNTLESRAEADKLKFVYDFSTSQANGKISCLCLTSKTGGMIGYGNPKGDFYDNDQNLTSLTRNLSLADICPQSALNTYKTTRNKIVCNGRQYSFTLDGTNLKIGKFKVPLKNANIGDCIPEDITIDVSSLHYSWMGGDYIVSASEGVIYLTPRGTAKASGSFFVWAIDTTDDSLEELEFNFGVTSINVSFSHQRVFVPVYEGHTFKVFNLDGTSYDEIETGTLVWNSDISSVVGDFGNHTLLCHYDLQGANFYYMLYDSQTKKAFPTNMTYDGYNKTQGLRMEETSKALTMTYYASGTSSKETLAFNNPLYLATINNLNQSVTKDISLSMKIEYTLEES